MRIYDIRFPIIIILAIVCLGLVNITYGENMTMTTRSYENANFGIKLSYPYEWGRIVEEHERCPNQSSCALGLNDTIVSYPVGFNLFKYSKDTCDCTSLMEFVKNMYKDQSRRVDGFSFMNDSQTKVGKNYSGWQYDYSYLNKGTELRGTNVFAKSNDTYYLIGVVYPDQFRGSVLPEFNRVIDSIEFIPIAIPKKPSFINASEMEQTRPSPSLGSTSNGVQILSSNDFISSTGSLHVVGEVQNNTPMNIQFVKVTGTFYDSNNQVVATDLTYTDPSNIISGGKAPFDLLLISASIPISQIDHYNLVASYQ